MVAIASDAMATPEGGEKTTIYHMLTMHEQITIQTLHKQGMTNAEIARTLGCHRNTVLKVLKRETTIEKQTRVKPSIFDRCRDQIRKWLEQEITNHASDRRRSLEYNRRPMGLPGSRWKQWCGQAISPNSRSTV